MGIREYIGLFRRYWHLIGICATLALLGASVVTLRKQDLYMSSSKILLIQPRSYLVLQTGGEMPEFINLQTQINLVRSTEVAEQVGEYWREIVANRGYDPVRDKDKEYQLDDPIPATAPCLNQAIPSTFQIMNMIQISEVPDTNIINVISVSTDKYTVALIPNLFATAFRKRSERFNLEKVLNTKNYLNRQEKRVKALLDRQEDLFEAFKQKSGILNLETFEESYSQRLGKIAEAKSAVETDLLVIRQEIDAMETQFRGEEEKVYFGSGDSVNESGPEMLAGAIFEEEMKLEELLQRYTLDHPQVEGSNKRIGMLKRKMKKLNEQILSKQTYSVRNVMDIERSLRDLRIKEAGLQGKLEKLKREESGELKKFNFVEKDWKEVQRLLSQKKLTETRYSNLLNRIEEIELKELNRENNIRIIEKARVGAVPINDTAKRDYMIAILFGLFVGLAISYFIEESRELIRASEDVKRLLGLPVLGTVPHQGGMDGRLVSEIPVKSPFAESFKQLAFMIELQSLQAEKQLKTFVVTSSKVSEGKSSVLANLAITMSQQGERVAMVDTDMRRPMLHRFFNQNNALGLTNVLNGELEAEIELEHIKKGLEPLSKEELVKEACKRAICKTDYPGLFLVPCGPIPLNSIELIKSDRFLEFVDAMKSFADIILFDSPPAIHVVDPIVLANKVDGIIWVISSGMVNKDDGQNVKKMLESGKGKLLGVALNNITKESREYYHHYYYYAHR